MNRPAVGHRSAEFKDVLKHLTQGLRYLFQTKDRVLLLTGSATLGMEAAISNVIGPADKILVLENGKFGERFSEIARLYTTNAEIVKTEMGQPLDLARADGLLSKGGFKAMAAVLNESSTGVHNPGAQLAELARKHDVLFLADGVTAVGGVDVPVDKWGIDACVVGSQKCIGAPPGATLLSLSDAYYDAIRPRSLYMNLKDAADKWADGESSFTPATHLYLAVEEALELLAEETLEKRIERSFRMTRSVRAGMAALNIPLLVPDEIASQTVTAARYPEGVTEKDVREVLKQDFGVVVAGGQGSFKGKIFRVGTMGFTRSRELLGFLGGLEIALARTSHVFPPGGGVSAFQKAWATKPSP